MDKLIALGTGNAMVTHCYNTCFALCHQDEILLVDAGGGNGILRQMELANLSWARVHHMILTHAHCDHLTGAVWVLRKIATMMLNGKYEGILKIYAHPSVSQGLYAMAQVMLQGKFVKLIGERILFVDIAEGQQEQAGPYPVTFFDIRSTKLLQFGFRLTLPDGQTLVCLGDEPYNPACSAHPADADWLLCEAFCLYGDRERFKPYEKHHSTVKEACELARQERVRHLVLWHTEDSDIPNRKARYHLEGSQYYHGPLYVPDDLDVIFLSSDEPQL